MSNAFKGSSPEYTVSNEVWPTGALASVREQTHGTAAVLIGQAHATSVLPHLTATLETVAFVDAEPGHPEVFKAKMRVLEAMSPKSQYFDYAVSTAGVLEDDGIRTSPRQVQLLASETRASFDSTRSHRPQGVPVNAARRADLLTRYSSTSIDTLGILGIVEDKSLGKRVGRPGKLSWVHLSNVAEIVRGTFLAGRVIDFIEALDGVSDDTLVTYAVHDTYRRGDWWPSVHVARPSDITVDLLVRDQQNVPCLRNS